MQRTNNGPRRTRSVARTARPRYGATMAAVLVCLLVVMLVCGTLARALLLHHRQTQRESIQLQTLWLAESAQALAIGQLRADPEYPGETWRTAVDDAPRLSGVAEIQISRLEELPGRRLVTITATFPEDPLQRVVLQSEFMVDLPVPGEAE